MNCISTGFPPETRRSIPLARSRAQLIQFLNLFGIFLALQYRRFGQFQSSIERPEARIFAFLPIIPDDWGLFKTVGQVPELFRVKSFQQVFCHFHANAVQPKTTALPAAIYNSIEALFLTRLRPPFHCHNVAFLRKTFTSPRVMAQSDQSY